MKLALILTVLIYSSVGHAIASRDLWIPQSKTLPAETVSWDMQSLIIPLKENVNGNPSTHTMGVSLGLPEMGKVSVETGVDWTEPAIKSTSASLSASLRVAYGDVEQDGFAIAAGVQDYGFELNVNDFNIFYGLMQNKLGDGWEMALGGYAGNPKTLGNVSDGSGIIFGLWTGLNKRSTLGFEWQSGMNAFGYFFAGTKILMREGVTIILGYGAANDKSRAKDSAIVRTSITVF